MKLAGRAVAWAAAAGLAVGLAAVPAALAATSPHWRVFYTPPRSPSQLTVIAAIGRRDAWAAGSNNAGLYVVHWNGADWRRVDVPGGRNFVPTGIQATSANDVWISGSGGTEPAAMVYNGTAWDPVNLPEPSYAYAVVSSTDVWGIRGGSCTAGARPQCTTDIWHWSDGSVTTYSVAGEVQDIVAAGRHVWILAQQALHGGPPTSSSLPQFYYGDASGLHELTTPRGRIGTFPQIAASPSGQLWLLAPGLSRHAFGAVDYWNGTRWTRYAIPARPDVSFGSWGFIYDNHNGVWLGPYLHWTGRRWISTSPHGPNGSFELMFVAPVPGSASAWAVGFNSARPGSRSSRGLIALYGERP
jgi:hypothetical protein